MRIHGSLEINLDRNRNAATKKEISHILEKSMVSTILKQPSDSSTSDVAEELSTTRLEHPTPKVLDGR